MGTLLQGVTGVAHQQAQKQQQRPLTTSLLIYSVPYSLVIWPQLSEVNMRFSSTMDVFSMSHENLLEVGGRFHSVNPKHVLLNAIT